MESALKILRTLRSFMLATLVIYLGLVAGLPSQSRPLWVMFYALAMMSVLMVIAILVIRKVFVQGSEQLLIVQPADQRVLAKWQSVICSRHVE